MHACMSGLPVKYMQEARRYLEREQRVVRRLNGDVQHGGQHCTMQGVPPLLGRNRN
jgi:hypothetical protein